MNYNFQNTRSKATMTDKNLAELLKWIEAKQNLEKLLMSQRPTEKPVKLGKCQAFYETSEKIKQIMADNHHKPPK